METALVAACHGHYRTLEILGELPTGGGGVATWERRRQEERRGQGGGGGG